MVAVIYADSSWNLYQVRAESETDARVAVKDFTQLQAVQAVEFLVKPLDDIIVGRVETKRTFIKDSV